MALHLWHTQKLVSELASDSLSERDGMKYMLVGVLLYAYNSYWGLWFGAYRDWGFFAELFVVVAVGVLGVFECYKANGDDNGEDFILRYCALRVPIGFKLAILGFVVGQMFYFGSGYVLDQGTFRDPAFVYRLVSSILPVTLAFLYYRLVAQRIALVWRLRRLESQVAA